jgi:hypothetical protein
MGQGQEALRLGIRPVVQHGFEQHRVMALRQRLLAQIRGNEGNARRGPDMPPSQTPPAMCTARDRDEARPPKR